MKRNGQKIPKPADLPEFVVRAERAMRRAARNIRAEHRAHNLPIIVWKNGKVVEKSV
ncbi:MAG TPA: hypothetical protein VIT91_02450 [Chthoniobacterales bacterium]